MFYNSIHNEAITLTDIDRGVYVTILLEYLQFLHFIIEQWSRMNGVQELLLECGAFYLLLNELHTASTTHVSECYM